ncbi:hypothetical protein PMIN01_09588 [Paraphaeosphaeria minitans]|uniref:Uncharacterized protein n=1 Tax=Paraphaeosphaeria minitans TaxID=565426 RepID=A0A9P6KN92_9PLEO|nr:hypothetical protein PMIN01_09588 [Paraphaeosphaeria minitans]
MLAAACTCPGVLSRALLDVRQAAIASATPGGVRAGNTGPSPATTSTGDPSYGTVVFAFASERGVVGRACPAVAICHLGGVHGDKGSPPLLATSGDETDHGELLCPLGPGPRAAPVLRTSTRTGQTAAARQTRLVAGQGIHCWCCRAEHPKQFNTDRVVRHAASRWLVRPQKLLRSQRGVQ